MIPDSANDGYSVVIGDSVLRLASAHYRVAMTNTAGRAGLSVAISRARAELVVIDGGISDERLIDHIVAYGLDEESSDARNLREAALIAEEDILLSMRSCETCKSWWFDVETGKVSSIGGINLRRPRHAPVPCETSAGCRKGKWDNPIEFSSRNVAAYRHWISWRTVGCPMPQDYIMRRNWMWFSAIRERAERGRHSSAIKGQPPRNT